MSIPALHRWTRRIWVADRDALDATRGALEALDADAADRHDGEACDRIADLMIFVDWRLAKCAAEHAEFMCLGARLHTDAPAVKAIRRPPRRVVPRRRGRVCV
jgi:hypothetical protein